MRMKSLLAGAGLLVAALAVWSLAWPTASHRDPELEAHGETARIDTAAPGRWCARDRLPSVSEGPPTLGRAVKTVPRMVPSAADRADRAYNRGLIEASRDRSDTARAALRQALAYDRRHRHAREALVVLAARASDHAEVASLLSEGRALDPDHAGYALLEARIRANRGDVLGAIGVLEGAAAPLVEAPEALAVLAALYQHESRHDDAARLYGEALRLDWRKGAWWMGLGISREAQGRPEQAAAAYRGARLVGGLDVASRTWVEERLDALPQPAAPPPASPAR